VRLRHVFRRYRGAAGDVPALDDVSLEIAPGDMVALTGPSGCGKSSTLNIIAGVDRCDSGEVEVCGVDMNRAKEGELNDLRRARIGIVFQQFYLMPHLTVEENVMMPLALDGRSDAARVKGLLDRVGLSARMRHFPSELSGGEQQRVAIARALAHRPRLVLADEPTGNLDSRNGEAVLDLLQTMRLQEGAALLLVTHDAAIARRASRVLSMKDGRIDR
jgi:putative ABC transport system ATP-binding protein